MNLATSELPELVIHCRSNTSTSSSFSVRSAAKPRADRRAEGMGHRGRSIQSTSVVRTVKQFIQIETLRSIYI